VCFNTRRRHQSVIIIIIIIVTGVVVGCVVRARGKVSVVAVPNNSVVVSEAAPAELVPAAEGLAARHVITAIVFFDWLKKKKVASGGGAAIRQEKVK
jgi:hypothetical protein